jgi:transposase
MAGKTKTMHQIRKLLQQKLKGWSNRRIHRETGISRITLRSYLNKLNSADCSIEKAIKLDDHELSKLLRLGDEKDTNRGDGRQRLYARFEYMRGELRRVGVTRLLLWEEYLEEEENGYGYTQFCEHYRRWSQSKQVVARMDHNPGERLEVDYAGKKLSYVDRDTGEVILCEVFVAALPFSGMSYVEASLSQKQEEFIGCLSNALKWIGGVPQSILTDNLKSSVTKSDRYEPSFTELMEQFESFYQVTATATRVRKPRDKPKVESAVKITYQRIYARLRNEVFYSLQDLNAAIVKCLERHLDKHFQNRIYSRKDLFESKEKNTLSPLPSEAFIIKKSREYKVRKDYHVMLGEDKHFYSVPYTLVGQKVRVTYTRDAVEIYHNFKRVAVHFRNRSSYGHSTQKSHMPDNHKYEADRRGWDAEHFKRKARRIGPVTEQVFDKILARPIFIEQSFTSCLGVLRLGGIYGYDRLEAACTRAMQAQNVTYRMLKHILEKKLDMADGQLQIDFTTPPHDNIRGPEQYQ